MADNRIVVLPAELVEKIDKNRGDVSRADFISALLDNVLRESQGKEAISSFITRQELEGFRQDVRALLRSFLDFFIAYGLELGTTTSSKKDELGLLEQRIKEVTEMPSKPGRVSKT
jgi:hypothetical protein